MRWRVLRPKRIVGISGQFVCHGKGRGRTSGSEVSEGQVIWTLVAKGKVRRERRE